MQPMMKNSPAVPMPQFTQQGNGYDEQNETPVDQATEDPGAEDMERLQQGISQLNPQELQEFDALITPRLAQLIIKMFPTWAPVFMQFMGNGQGAQPMQAGAPMAQSQMRNIQAG